jgi:hypothetical protein
MLDINPNENMIYIGKIKEDEECVNVCLCLCMETRLWELNSHLQFEGNILYWTHVIRSMVIITENKDKNAEVAAS